MLFKSYRSSEETTSFYKHRNKGFSESTQLCKLCVYLLVKVGFSELQRVEQSVGSSQFHVVTGLLLPHPLDDGRQDLVGVFLQLFWVLKETTGHRCCTELNITDLHRNKQLKCYDTI